MNEDEFIKEVTKVIPKSKSWVKEELQKLLDDSFHEGYQECGYDYED